VAIESSTPDLPVVPPEEEGGAFIPKIVTVDVLNINQDDFGELSSLISQSGSNVEYDQFSASQFKLIAPNGYSRGVVNITASVQRNTNGDSSDILWIMINASSVLPSTFIARAGVDRTYDEVLTASGSRAFSSFTIGFERYRVYIATFQNTTPDYWKGARVTFIVHWFS
jgi:hypothetical protein